jgi:hypothetical protein
LTYIAPERTYTLLYTGDFFLSNSRLVEGLPLEEFRGRSPDVLILEGSLGTMRHPHRRSQENRLVNRILEAIADHQSVLLPLPTLGMGQEVLMLLRSHHKLTGKELDIWVDPDIAQICDAYLDLMPHLPIAIQNFALHQPLFWDQKVCPRVGRLEDHLASQARSPGQPSIFLLNQDQDWHQLPQSLPGSNCLALLPQDPQPNALHEPYETYLLDTHSDVAGSTQLIHNLKPQHLIFVHGQLSYLLDLANLDELRNRYHVHCPSPGKILELPISTSLRNARKPKRSPNSNSANAYPGELTELGAEVTLALPMSLTHDPRWAGFAETGLIEARWQGEDLLIHGISQKEILSAHYHEAPQDFLPDFYTETEEF